MYIWGPVKCGLYKQSIFSTSVQVVYSQIDCIILVYQYLSILYFKIIFSAWKGMNSFKWQEAWVLQKQRATQLDSYPDFDGQVN